MVKRSWKIRMFLIYVLLMILAVMASTAACNEINDSTEELIDGNADYALSGGHWLVYGGQYVQAGKTLKLSWSADGEVDGYIFTESQYNSYRPMGIASRYEVHSSGRTGSISTKVKYGDIYYAIVDNGTWFSSSKKIYEAKLTMR